MVDRYVSPPIELSEAMRSGEYARADLVFRAVDHSGASFEGRIYINVPEADVSTGLTDPAYAGSFHVFGHGGCFGDVGHCDVPTGPRDPFDLRQPHQLTPATKVVIVTEGLRRAVIAAGPDERGTSRLTAITVTVIAVALGEASNEVLAFEELHLLSYR